MKITAKNHPQSGPFFPQSGPDCCNLQSGRNLNSLIHMDLFRKSRLRMPDCGEPPQSGKYPYKSTTYVKIPDCTDTLSLREREGNPAYAGLPLQECAKWMEQAGTV